MRKVGAMRDEATRRPPLRAWVVRFCFFFLLPWLLVVRRRHDQSTSSTVLSAPRAVQRATWPSTAVRPSRRVLPGADVQVAC